MLHVFTWNFSEIVVWKDVLCWTDLKSPKSVYWKKVAIECPIETQCILPQEKRKCQKHHFPGLKIRYFTTWFIWKVGMSWQLFYHFIDTWNWINSISIVQTISLKEATQTKCDSEPLFYSKWYHFLTCWSVLMTIVANYAYKFALTKYIQGLCLCTEFWRQIKYESPIYLLLPLSIFGQCV